MKIFILLFAASIIQQANAQQTLPVSGILIQEGLKAYDTGDYKKAIEQFALVPEGDTNYSTALYEMALGYIADTQYDKGVQTIRTALELPDSDPRPLLFALAGAYDYKEQRDSAFRIFRQLTELNPNDHQPWYETGVVYYRKQEFDSAIRYFQQALLINPQHIGSHVALGTAYALQGRLTEGWIALQGSLLYAGNYAVAEKPLDLLNSIFRQIDLFADAYKNKKEDYSHPIFDEIDAIIHAKIVLSDKYKINSVMSDEEHAKVTYAILEKLQYSKGDDNFAMNYYVPLLLDIRDRNMTDQYLLQLYSGYGFEKIDKLVSKDKKEIQKFRDIAYPYFAGILATRTLNYEDRGKAPLRYQYLPPEKVYVEARYKALNVTGEGPVKIYKNGSLIAEGAYNDKGEKNGVWHYYHNNGKLKSTETLRDGKMTGEERNWHRNGQLASVIRYNEEGVSVSMTEYNTVAELQDEYIMQADKNVRHNAYYSDGSKKRSLLLREKKYVDGAYDNWWPNGQVQKHFEIRNDKIYGNAREYFDNGKLREEYSYDGEGLISGPYKEYYQNGRLAFSATYTAGKLDGLMERWDENGRPTAKEEYKKGKLNGKKHYYDEGIAFGVVDYSEDKALAYEFSDINGKPVAADKGPLKILKTFFSNGNPRAYLPMNDTAVNGMARYYFYGGPLQEEVQILNWNKEGLSKGFHKMGTRNFELNYKKNVLDGFARYYHFNGMPSAEGHFLEGSKQGPWTYYNAFGKRNRQLYFDAGAVDAYDIAYNVNGEATEKDFYFQKAIYRLVQYDSAGKEFRRTEFKEGNGDYELINPVNGKVWFKTQVKNGQLHGPYQKMLPDGSLYEKGSYAYGERSGTVTSYNRNGQKTYTALYKAGQKQDSCIFYHEVSGEKTLLAIYKNNELDGKRLTFENGTLRFESNYKDGDREGEQYVYGEDRRLALVLYFSDGILMAYSYEGTDGKLLPRINISNGTGDVNAFYANGKKSAQLHYTQSSLDGRQVYYFTNGSPCEESIFKNRTYCGPYKTYHLNGKVKVDCTYTDDELHGAYREYDESGKVIISRNYVYGQQHGVSEVLNNKANTLQKIQYRYGYALKML